MASVLGGRNNCPTSGRDGICVDSAVNRETIKEIEGRSINPFMPDAADIAARDAREALFVPDDVGDLQSEIEATGARIAAIHSAQGRKAEEVEQSIVAADIADRQTTLANMPEPTAEELAMEEEPTAEELIAAYNEENQDEVAA